MGVLLADYDRYDWDYDEYTEGFIILTDYFMRDYDNA
jgi:hypothetical protein